MYNIFSLKKENIFLLSLIIFSSLIVTFRDPAAHSDSARYVELFYEIQNSGRIFNLEPIFYLLNLFALSFNSHEVLFFSSMFLKSILYIFVIRELEHMKNSKEIALMASLLLIFQFIDNWHYVLTVDAMKQGISIPFILLAAAKIHNKKIISSLIFMFLAYQAHYSSLLLLPFLFLLRANFATLITIYIISTLMYATQFNFLISQYFSELTQIAVFEAIENYARGEEIYFGFQLRFFLYSIFIVVAALVAYSLRLPSNSISEFAMKCSLIFASYFYIFAFASFTNRYAFYLWSLLPLIAIAVVFRSRITFTYSQMAIIYFFGTNISLTYLVYRMYFEN